jgi:hypothetical protein
MDSAKGKERLSSSILSSTKRKVQPDFWELRRLICLIQNHQQPKFSDSAKYQHPKPSSCRAFHQTSLLVLDSYLLDTEPSTTRISRAFSPIKTPLQRKSCKEYVKSKVHSSRPKKIAPKHFSLTNKKYDWSIRRCELPLSFFSYCKIIDGIFLPERVHIQILR